MRLRNINSLLAIIFAALMITSTATVFATTKPTITNPAEATWADSAYWGTNLRFENVAASTVSEVWYGVGTSYATVAAPPDPVTGLVVEFMDPTYTTNYFQVVDPTSSTHVYHVNFRKIKAANPNSGTVSSTMGDIDNNYVPEDFSVVLKSTDNLSPAININLRAGSGIVSSSSLLTTPRAADLTVENAVNVTVSPGSQTAGTGAIVNYTVTVYNTGSNNDTYNLSATDNLGATTITFDSASLAINAGNNASTTMHVTLLSGNQTITIEATGAYAADEVTCTAMGLPISVTITPSHENGWTGENVTDTIVVKNNGATADNYQLTLTDNAIPSWQHGWDAPSQVAGTPIYGNIYAVLDNTNGGKDVGDSYVRENDPNWDNYQFQPTWPTPGGRYNMYVGVENRAGYGQSEYVFLKWNISLIPAGAIIDNAYMKVYGGTYGPANPAPLTTNADNMWVEAWNVNNDAWNENTLTWNNKPATGATLLDNNHWLASNWGGGNTWYTWTVSSFVASEFAGDKVVSIVLKSNGVGDDSRLYNAGWYYTKDNTSAWRAPYLLVSYHTVAIIGYTPSENTVSLGPGESWTGTLWTVVGGVPCTTDQLTVTATSMTNPTITTSAIKLVHNNVAGVTVTPPANQSLVAGTYIVPFTITNNGGLTDTFNLVLSNSAGWTITGLPASVIIPAGGSVVENLSVVVPGTPGATDNIDVEATSVGDNTKTDTQSTLITVKSGLAQVEVTILPDPLNPDNIAHPTSVGNVMYDPAWKYDPLTFAVKVANKGALDDKYELTVSGVPEGMGLKLTPDELFVPAGDAEYVSLSITLPDTWLGGVSGTVTVTAVGMLASENQVPIGASDNDNVIVKSGVVDNVAKWILPDELEPQTAAPNSPLVWVLVLKNTGNQAENLSVSLSESLTGVSSSSAPRNSWGAVFDNDNWLNVPAGTKVQTYLRVTPPKDAKTSEWDTIVITASDGKGATDIENVRAHVVEAGPRIPEGQIEISVEAQIIAIEVWPNTWDFGVMDEDKLRDTTDNYFTVRNTGNIVENILIRGTDAQSMPGEPVATWTLSDVSIGTDQYMMKVLGPVFYLSKTNKFLTTLNTTLSGSGYEFKFGLQIQAPSAITTPARMWARIKLTAVAAVPPS